MFLFDAGEKNTKTRASFCFSIMSDILDLLEYEIAVYVDGGNGASHIHHIGE